MGDASAPSAGASSGMGGGGGAPGGGDMSPSGGGVPSINFQIRWQSAAPIKAALVRSKMGKEADTSAEAKAFIEKEEETYVVALIMPGMGGEGAGPAGAPAGGPDAEKRITDSTTHFWKGHEDVHPVKVIMPKQNSPAFVFHFAKTHAIELEDKEVEFATRRGPMEIKKKFRLRDMVYNGKLAP